MIDAISRDLDLEIRRVSGDYLPRAEAIPACSGHAMMARHALDRATAAIRVGDLVEMVAWHAELQEFRL